MEEKQTFQFRVVRHHGRALLMFLHAPGEPDDATWSAAMDAAATLLRESATNTAFLVITDGGAPNAVQRNRLASAAASAQFPVGVVSDSPLVRSAVTAIGWFNKGTRSFAPSRWADAVQHAGFAAADAPFLLEEMRRVQRALATPVKCLQEVERHAR